MHVTCAHVFAYYNVQQNSSRATLTSPPHSLHQPPLLFSGFTEISLSFLACRYFVILYILARNRWDCQEEKQSNYSHSHVFSASILAISSVEGNSSIPSNLFKSNTLTNRAPPYEVFLYSVWKNCSTKKYLCGHLSKL